MSNYLGCAALVLISILPLVSAAQAAPEPKNQPTSQKISKPSLTSAQAHFEPLYEQLRQEFNATNAYNTVAFVEQRWRLAGNAGFNESIRHVEKILQEAGFQKQQNSEKEAELSYRIETRKMAKPTWEPIAASLNLIGAGDQQQSLLNFSTNRNMIAINSASTPDAGVKAEVVYVGKGRSADLKDKDLRGKIVFVENAAAAVYKQAVSAGAVGVMSYSMPAYTQPQKYQDSIQFQSVPQVGGDKAIWALVLSYQAKERLKSALQNSAAPVLVQAHVSTKQYQAEELTLVANIRGRTQPEQRFVFSAHVQEPGANDNATGVGTLAEMARVAAKLVKEKKYVLDRTITFLWGDEIVSTQRYINEDPQRAKGIMWGLSLDMVGEDVSKTGGSFLIEKMPDPSAIWTRGNDKHTEWGGSVLKESDMVPNYFTDYLINRCVQQGLETGWVVNANPFEGGSDHTPFLQAKIPGLLMWHFTDTFYHTDLDRLDKVSKDEMHNVGICGLASAWILSSADENTALIVGEELSLNAKQRLQTEFSLSQTATRAGADVTKEKHILATWADWYVRSVDLLKTLPLGTLSNDGKAQIDKAKRSITDLSQQLQNQL
ncbi:M28 family peptidase [Undibacterium cyanobacteriorum]|uniref:M28 family peptidase n=1 Tax=Undibacterium cyanobacteriorum TaxID=3073561 RepID=A0ABY9RJX0_9BURK|nr:M28 family peptidase [Undibacterium sp. 20NA77.5]WMW81528.1 M28 family peptidase [Undibacterium sp. 20NA77.5]